MRRRTHLAIGAAATLAATVAVTGIASGAGTLTGQTLTTETQSGKLDKKKRIKPLNNLKISVDTSYTGTTPPFTGKATSTKVDFPRDFAFNTKGVAQCDPNVGTFNTSTTEAAIAQCGPSQIGTGDAALAGPVAGVTAKVTAFNGTTSGGLPTVLLHTRTGAPLNSTAVLTGVLRTSDQGSKYGSTLDVTVPLLAGGAFVITHFDTSIPKKQTKKKQVIKKRNKKTGKVTKKVKPARFYISARCTKNRWDFQARTDYTDGAQSTIDTHQTTSKSKNLKKKKKPKKKR